MVVFLREFCRFERYFFLRFGCFVLWFASGKQGPKALFAPCDKNQKERQNDRPCGLNGPTGLQFELLGDQYTLLEMVFGVGPRLGHRPHRNGIAELTGPE